MGADIDEVSHLLHEIHSLGRAMNKTHTRTARLR